MPLVILLLPDGDTGTQGPVSFSVAPQTGQSVLLNAGARRRFYLVDQVFHGMTTDGREILYFAVLSRAPKNTIHPRVEAQL